MELVTLCGFILLLLPISAQAADIPDSSPRPQGSRGRVEGTDTDGKPHKVAYALSSGGTSLTETLTPPDNPAMTTMHYSDGGPADADALLLAEQPAENAHQRREGGEEKTFTFMFVDATNLTNPTDVHMHQLVIDLKDHDHFTQTWTLSKAEKDVPKVFPLNV